MCLKMVSLASYVRNGTVQDCMLHSADSHGSRHQEERQRQLGEKQTNKKNKAIMLEGMCKEKVLREGLAQV